MFAETKPDWYENTNSWIAGGERGVRAGGIGAVGAGGAAAGGGGERLCGAAVAERGGGGGAGRIVWLAGEVVGGSEVGRSGIFDRMNRIYRVDGGEDGRGFTGSAA